MPSPRYLRKNKVFRLALAPEGTRKRVTHLKTGFYHIAKQAKVPILPVGFDYKNKKVIFFPLFEPTASLSADFKKLEGYFYGIEGKIRKKIVLQNRLTVCVFDVVVHVLHVVIFLNFFE